VEIRRATPDDVPAILEILRRTFEEYGFKWVPEYEMRDLLDYVYDGEVAALWVAVEGDTVLACGGLDWSSPVPGEPGSMVAFEGDLRVSGCRAELVRLYVDPGLRRGGLGRALCDVIRAEAEGRGFEILEIWSDIEFTLAHAFYEKLGAERVGTRSISEGPLEYDEFGFVWRL
jgi:ribosomal protein S18 acetylase RimI-like enzyme